ncbi:MAG: riboflavin biosynthesis protein RibF [Clostridia bacterium]|nr:riboflavin biosynthesis protein RibF [Clostridia bacterium]
MALTCISLETMQPAPISEATILCLGNFDGVHIGHRALLERARELKETQFPDAVCGVFCFDTYPADHLLPKPPKHLLTPTQKLARFREAGMDFAILAHFPSLRSLSPETFAKDVLLEQCHAVGLVCGFNYHFGKNGCGTPETLRSVLDIPVSVVDEVVADGDTVSSTRIRSLLARGAVEEATRLLGRPYGFTAPVEHGKALGRRLGAPTINQYFPAQLQELFHGVYVTECRVDGRTYRGVTNVGTRPTVECTTLANCETYLLDFEGTLYGKDVEIAFLSFLRPERKFESPDALREQIALDIASAKEF